MKWTAKTRVIMLVSLSRGLNGVYSLILRDFHKQFILPELMFLIWTLPMQWSSYIPMVFGVNALVDGGYSRVNFKLDIMINLQATLHVAKNNELHKFEVLPQHWLVERLFSWLEKCRRFCKNYERQLHTNAPVMNLTFISVLLRLL